jgi:5-methyltetrahydropteroyltriglutamate--homocysteine methyltransferase
VIHSDERVLTTHTGSLPRPDDLAEINQRAAAGGTVAAGEREKRAAAAVRASIAAQVAAGVDIGNDGEQRRVSFSMHLRDRIGGLGGTWVRPGRADVERYPAFKAMRRLTISGATMGAMEARLPMATSAVSHLDPEATRAECADLLAAVAETPGFVETFCTAPSPGVLATTIRNAHYATEDAYLDALSEIMRVEYESIVAAGLLLQVDCPDLALERHIRWADEPLPRFLEFVEKAIDALNRALAGVPRDRVRMHVCWGNSESPHDCDVPLDDILPLLLRADVGALVLPFAGPRHGHEYRCFERFPLADDQLLVAGCIDTLTNVVEHPQVVADRLVRVAEVVGDPRRVLAGTDCGFDTAAGIGRVAPDVVLAKLGSLAEGARLATARLFG